MSATTESLKLVYEQYVQEAKNIANKKQEVLDTLAELNCPLHVGDLVMSKKYKKAKVSKIVGWGTGQDFYYVYGKNIRKDGSEGAEFRLWDFDDWRVVKE